jgi:hypothetical protein
MRNAFAQYCQDVQSRSFPGAEHSIEMNEMEWQNFLQMTHSLKISDLAEVTMK